MGTTPPEVVFAIFEYIRKTPFLLFATFHAFMSKKSKFSESTNYF